MTKLGLPSHSKVFLAGRVQDVAADSELQRQDPAQGTDDTTLKGFDERLRARWEEGVSVGVSGIEVFGDEERVGDDSAGVGVADDGEGVCWRAIVLGSCGRRTDLFGEGLNVWVLHPLGLVGDTLDVECVSAVAFSSTIFSRKGGPILPRLPCVGRPRVDAELAGDIVKDDWRGHCESRNAWKGGKVWLIYVVQTFENTGTKHDLHAMFIAVSWTSWTRNLPQCFPRYGQTWEHKEALSKDSDEIFGEKYA